MSWVLAVDQASNAAGVSLWFRGELQAHSVLLSDKSTDTISRRLRSIVCQLHAFLLKNLPADEMVRQVIFEGVKSRIVMLTIGAFLACHSVDAKFSEQKNLVPAAQWKKYAQKHGAQGVFKDIKGVKALREIGFPVDEHRIMSDDVADSVLIYLTWQQRNAA